jgi:hypothetical protein
MSPSRKILAALVACAATAAAAESTCYEIVSPRNDLVHRSPHAPVDMSKPISQALAQRGLAGHHLTFYLSATCDELEVPETVRLPVDPASGWVAPGRGGGTLSVVASSVDSVLDGVYQRSRGAYGHGAAAAAGLVGGRTMYTGRRGGTYYINSAGNRQYVPRVR